MGGCQAVRAFPLCLWTAALSCLLEFSFLLGSWGQRNQDPLFFYLCKIAELQHNLKPHYFPPDHSFLHLISTLKSCLQRAASTDLSIAPRAIFFKFTSTSSCSRPAIKGSRYNTRDRLRSGSVPICPYHHADSLRCGATRNSRFTTRHLAIENLLGRPHDHHHAWSDGCRA